MYEHFKRVVDLLVALFALVLLFIPGVLIAIWIKTDSEGPIFFKQERIGRNKQIFEIYKFRSMRIDAPKSCPPNKFMNAESFITKSGNILRKTSLDELPQLINAIKGDMSIIGPRPGAAKNEDDLIVERDKYNVFDVRPGISGWAQVNGRDGLALDIKEKARVDGEYVREYGPIMDLKCLFLTISTVITGKGYQEGAMEALLPQPTSVQAPIFYARIESKSKTANRPIRRRQLSNEQPPTELQNANTYSNI